MLVVPSKQIMQFLFLPGKYIRIWTKHTLWARTLCIHHPKQCVPTVLTRAKLQTKTSESQYSRDKTLLLGPFLGFPAHCIVPTTNSPLKWAYHGWNYLKLSRAYSSLWNWEGLSFSPSYSLWTFRKLRSWHLIPSLHGT